MKKRWLKIVTKGTEGVNYKNLSQAKVAGRELRAVQLAQNAVKKLGLSEQMDATTIAALWSQIATVENGFRSTDINLEETEEFRNLVMKKIEKILRQGVQIEDRTDGRPRSWLEVEATNKMVEEINRTIKRQIAGVEAKDAWRYRREAVTRKVMGGLSKWQGLFPSNPEARAELEGLKTAAEAQGVRKNDLITLMEVAWQELMKGTDSIFRRIHEETVQPPEDRTAVLDLPILGKMIRNLSASLIGGEDLTEVFANPHIQECLEEGASLTVAHEVESTYDEETTKKKQGKIHRMRPNPRFERRKQRKKSNEIHVSQAFRVGALHSRPQNVGPRKPTQAQQRSSQTENA
jgi:hypothetical protein